jgi:hypothetical protein
MQRCKETCNPQRTTYRRKILRLYAKEHNYETHQR